MIQRLAKIKWLWFRFKVFAGIQRTLPTKDREVLEKHIFARLRESDCQRILFVGCDWYTRTYNDIFADREYWTLEIDPEKRRFGSSRHVVDSLENIEAHFAPDYFDAIVCNGVFGWGLNEPAAVERAFQGCFSRLREGGLFVLGWNDVPEHRPFHPLESQALQAFDRYVLPSVEKTDMQVPGSNRHTFSFFQRPAAVAASVAGASVNLASLVSFTAMAWCELGAILPAAI